LSFSIDFTSEKKNNENPISVNNKLTIVDHACDLSYAGGHTQEEQGLRLAPGTNVRSYSKNN
jgi:hypothetical protein